MVCPNLLTAFFAAQISLLKDQQVTVKINLTTTLSKNWFASIYKMFWGLHEHMRTHEYMNLENHCVDLLNGSAASRK